MVFLVALAVLSGLDIATTLWGFAHGFVETAPFMTWVASFGELEVIPVRVGLVFLLYWLASRPRRKLPGQVLAAAILATAVVNNFWLIQGP